MWGVFPFFRILLLLFSLIVSQQLLEISQLVGESIERITLIPGTEQHSGLAILDCHKVADFLRHVDGLTNWGGVGASLEGADLQLFFGVAGK